jgi:hypothetical protein
VAEIRSFKWDFFAVHFELFLDVHGQGQDTIPEFWPKIVELFTKLVFLVGIGWYFTGILPTNPNRKLGW